MTAEIPDDLLLVAQAAFSGRTPMTEGGFVLPEERSPWTALHDALAAVLPAHERQVREQVAAKARDFADQFAAARSLSMERDAATMRWFAEWLEGTDR